MPWCRPPPVAWPAPAGRITSSEASREASTNRDGDRTVPWVPRVSYRYTVNGAALEGTRIRFGLDSQSREESAATVAPYPVGRAVTVYYDPAKPTESVLERLPPKG